MYSRTGRIYVYQPPFSELFSEFQRRISLTSTRVSLFLHVLSRTYVSARFFSLTGRNFYNFTFSEFKFRQVCISIRDQAKDKKTSTN